MSTKTILNFKNSTYDKFLITYLGARTIQSSLTKVSLISSLLESNLNNTICTISTKNGKAYTLAQLYQKGLDKIKSSFLNILNIKNDDKFLIEIQRLGINELIIPYDYNEKAAHTIAKAIIKNSCSSFFSAADFESLTDVIHPLGTYIDEEDECTYFFKSNQKEYWVFEEIRDIISRYRKVVKKYKYYSILTDFIFKEINKLGLMNKYEFFSSEDLLNINNNTIEFYNEFFHLLEEEYKTENKYNLPKCLNINGEFEEGNLKELKENLPYLIKENPELDYTYFNIDNFLYLLMENDLRKILKTSLTLDFREYLNSSLIGDGSDFYYKKAFIEKLQIMLNEPKSTFFKVMLR